MKIARTLIALAILAPFIALAIGCEAAGWAPGPVTSQVTRVPVPGFGTFELAGERDTSVQIVGVDGSNTTTWPSVDSIVVTRSASGPLGTRGAQQYAIEDMRWERAINNFERATDKLLQVYSAVSPMLQAYYPPPTAAPAAAKLVDNLKATIVEAVQAAVTAEIAKRYPASQPASP